MANRPQHTNKKQILESIFNCSTKKEASAFIGVTTDGYHHIIERELGLDGALSISELREIIITTANNEPDSELARIIRIIKPEVVKEYIKPLPVVYPECGSKARVVNNSSLPSIRSSGGIPFKNNWNWLRAKRGI